MFKIRRFNEDEMKSYLTKYNDISEVEVDQSIYISDGDINKAERYLNISETGDLENLKLWMRACYSKNFSEINNQIDWFNLLSKIRKRAFMTYCLKLMREALVSNIDEKLSRISEDEKKFIEKFKMTLDISSFEKIVLSVDESIRFLDRNANPKILFLDLSIKISDLFSSRVKT